MYLRITSKCNMTCEHCCNSCSPNEGEHMTKRTLEYAIDLANECSELITIGGGEPTVHPRFWEFVGYIIGHLDTSEESPIFMITNGKKTRDALKLAQLNNNERSVIMTELSQDLYHEEIDERVVKAFGKNTRCVNEHVKRVGRAKNWGYELGCVCDDIVIEPDGTIFPCGCRVDGEQMGTVFKPSIPDEYWEYDSKCKRERENLWSWDD